MALRNFATCHSHPQSLDSASTPEAFAKREIELGTGVITVTDHGSLAACRTVYDLAKKHKLIPVLGLEGYFRDDNCDILTAAGVSKNADGKFVDYFKYAHFCVHFLDQAAYECGVRLISKAPIERHGSETKPLFNWANLEELAQHNVTMTTGCLIGMVQRHLLDNNDPQMAVKYFQRLLHIFGKDRLFIEVFPHICDRNWVKGVFVELQEGDKIVKLKFHDGKKLKTNEGEVTAEDLAKAFLRKANKHELLNAVKDYNTWNDRSPAKILSVKKVEDFLVNECRPWAPDGDVQRGCNEFVMDLAAKYKVPILIADDSHFAHPDEKPVQDVRLMASGGSWRFYGSYHRQSSDEAYNYFKNKLGVSMKTFEGWVDNSFAWADRFKNFKFVTAPSLPTKFFPEDTLAHTLSLIKKHGRMDWKDPRAVARLDEEIELLHNNGTIDLLPYFFIDEEVCWEYTKAGLLTGPGRGSAAGVRLAYLLGITHADPFDNGLSLERFITLDRIKSGALPDIDQDLPNRDLLVAEGTGFLHKRYGDHFAQISVDTTLKLKSAMKDVCRVLAGRVLPEVEIYTRKLPDPPQGVSDHNFVFGYTDSGNWHPGIIEFNKDLQDYIAEFPKHWDIVRKALGLARQKSRHACGFVIANRPIHEFIPTTIISDTRCTAYTPASVEAVGGVKMDFLVINSLNDISNAIKLIQQRYGIPPEEGTKIDGKWVPKCRLIRDPNPEDGDNLVDIWKLPEDQRVFKEVSLGKTETVFQFNTPGAVQWLRQFAYRKGPYRYAIDSIEAMAAFTALDRPGPLDMFVESGEGGKKHNLLVEYARRARKAEPSPEIFPFFNKLFPETYGVMVYQEQLQKAYQYLTGCTGAEAEEFRRNVAKKKMEKVLAAYPAFKERAAAKLGSEEDADKCWEFFKTWGQYGFNKSHAVCYSIIAYACAYLKHHYPLEWWTAVLRNADKDEINNTFWRHAGHLIDLPDVSKSRDEFEILGNRIQAPLSLLHGIGEKAHQQLTAGRPYKDINDFCARIQEYKERNATFVTKKETKKKTNRKTKEVTVTEVEVVKKKLGRSALTRGVLYTLVVSGAMDSLFPAGYETLDMLQGLEEALARATGKEVQPVNPKYVNIDRFMRHQLRKKILPAYSAPLLPLIEDLAVAGKLSGLVKEQKRTSYHWKEKDWLPFASAKEIERIDTITPFPEDPIKVAVATYIDDVRPFTYARKDKATGVAIGTASAVEMNLDVDGARMKFVKWGNRDTGTLPTKWLHANLFNKAIGVAILSKYKEGKPFTLEDFIVIAEPLQDEPEESSKE